MTDYDDGFVEVEEGVRLHYVAAGSGPLVVFHHGFPSCWVSFRLQMDDFARDHRVVGIDGLGANRSSRPGDLACYRVARLVEQLDRLVRHVGGDDPFVLVGHDWGGALAWAFAQARPERLGAVVSLSAPPYNQLIELLQTSDDQRSRSSYMWDMRSGERHRWMTGDGGRRLWEYIYAPLRSLPGFDDDMDRALLDALTAPGAIDAGIDWYRSNVPARDALDGFEPWPSATAKVRVPGLLVWGDDDRTFVPAFVDGLHAYVDDLTVHRFAGVGHWPMIERPDEVNRIIRAFLARTVTSSRSG